MASPQLIVEIAFGADPGATPVWTDVSAYVRSVSIRRGRQRQLQRVEAGQATVTLNNADRRFEPQNPGSPYYPGVLPMRRIRIRAVWNSVTYDLFMGFVDAWPPRYGPPDELTVTATDAWKPLALATIYSAYPQELSGARVNRVLDEAGWPATDRAIDPGATTVPARLAEPVAALEHLQAVAEAELTAIFAGADGRVRFVDRTTLFTRSLGTLPVFGDAPGEQPYSDLTLAYDDELLYTEVRITRTGGVEQVAADPDAQQTYLRRVYAKSDFLVASDAVAADVASWLLNRFKDPALRAAQMQLLAHPSLDWSVVLGRELLDTVRIRRRPRNGGLIELVSMVQGINYDIAPGNWVVTWSLDAFGDWTAWVLDDQARSVLGSTTRLGV